MLDLFTKDQPFPNLYEITVWNVGNKSEVKFWSERHQKKKKWCGKFYCIMWISHNKHLSEPINTVSELLEKKKKALIHFRVWPLQLDRQLWSTRVTHGSGTNNPDWSADEEGGREAWKSKPGRLYWQGWWPPGHLFMASLKRTLEQSAPAKCPTTMLCLFAVSFCCC